MKKIHHIRYSRLRCYFYLLCLLLFPFFSIAEIDKDVGKYRQQLELAKSDTATARIMNMLAISYQNIDIDSALYFANKATNLAKQSEDDMLAGRCELTRGMLYVQQNNLDKGLESYKETLKRFSKVDFKEGIAGMLINLGIIYSEKGENTKALEYYFEAIKLFEELGNQHYVAMSYNNAGLIYTEQKKYAESNKCYQKVLEIAKSENDPSSIALAYHNIGSNYVETEEYEKALQSFEITENNVGDKDPRLRGLNYGEIARAHKLSGNNDKAVEYIVKAIEFQNSNQLLSDLPYSYELFQQILLNMGIEKDSIWNTRMIREMQSSNNSTSGDIEKLEKKIKKLEEEKKETESSKNNYMRYMYLFIATTCLLLLLFILQRVYRH